MTDCGCLTRLIAAQALSKDGALCRVSPSACSVNLSYCLWCFCRGGKKASGFGRELGTYGLSSYQNIKQITTYVSKDRWDWYPSKL